MAEIDLISVQIPAGAGGLSGQVDIGTKSLVGIMIPSTWVSAGISFQASVDGGTTWGELLDQTATAVTVSSITGGAATAIAIDPAKLRGFQSFKIRSGTSGAPVNQTGAPTLQLITRLAI